MCVTKLMLILYSSHIPKKHTCWDESVHFYSSMSGIWNLQFITWIWTFVLDEFDVQIASLADPTESFWSTYDKSDDQEKGNQDHDTTKPTFSSKVQTRKKQTSHRNWSHDQNKYFIFIITGEEETSKEKIAVSKQGRAKRSRFNRKRKIEELMEEYSLFAR